MNGSGRLADAAGNSPGPNSRFRLITGVKRVEIKTVAFKKIDPDLIVANTEVFTVTHVLANVQVEEVVQRTGRLGHLIKVDLGDYAHADDFTSVDSSQVALDYQVNEVRLTGSAKYFRACATDAYGCRGRSCP